MTTPSVVITLVLLLTSKAHADDVVVRAVELTAFGTFADYGKQFERGYSESGPGTESLEYVRFADITNQIPGTLGTNFGIQYIIHSTPKGRPFRVTGVILYPGNGLVTPDGHVYQSSQESMEIKIGEKSFYGFGFDHPWEIVPGDWKFQIRRGEAILAQKTLTVLAPDQALLTNPVVETGR